MLAFRSLDPFRALREPDRRRRDEERLSRSEQRTLSKTQNNHLTGKAPYKFESAFLHRRIQCEPSARFGSGVPNAGSRSVVLHAGPHRRTDARRGSTPARRLVVLRVTNVRAPGGALTLLAGFRQRQMRE